jgi:hypothetical protein
MESQSKINKKQILQTALQGKVGKSLDIHRLDVWKRRKFLRSRIKDRAVKNYAFTFQCKTLTFL